MLSGESKAEIRKTVGEYPDARSALLPALSMAQQDYGGWLPQEALEEIAQLLRLPPALVLSTASFYSMLHRKPVGRHVIQVCTNISCSLLGAQNLVELISQRLGIRPGETTADGRFSLLEVECLGSCGTAPMMQIDDQYYENLTEDGLDKILAGLG